MPLERALLVAQAVYYGVMAVWPLLSMRTFMAVSGPKVDQWLVCTVSWLLLCTSAALLLSPAPAPAPVLALALGNAAVLTGVDVYYAARGRIWRTYLLDAALEGLLIALWLLALARR